MLTLILKLLKIIMDKFSNRNFSMGKSIKHLTTSLFFFGIISINISAQDINFTLFNYSPLTLNPANTGNFMGDWRLAGNYRNQWATAPNPFRTSSISFDTKFNVFKQKLGAGLFFINDESGAGGLNYNKLFASLGYEKEINKNYFNLGLQLGYVFGSVSNWDTWDKSTRSIIASNGESNYKVSYPDVNAGVLWKKNIRMYEPSYIFFP
jgi:type IX secretion system PorP/SprF family membrane protein